VFAPNAVVRSAKPINLFIKVVRKLQFPNNFYIKIVVIAVSFLGITMMQLLKGRIKNEKLFITSGRRIINVPVAAKNDKLMRRRVLTGR